MTRAIEYIAVTLIGLALAAYVANAASWTYGAFADRLAERLPA